MKRVVIIFIALAIAVSMAGCKCSHVWEEATCTTPKTCAECGEMEGEPLGHEWEEASHLAPKKCSVCEETEGESLFDQCESWEEFFRLHCFSDDFTFMETALEDNKKAYTLVFDEIEDMDAFMYEAVLACICVGSEFESGESMCVFQLENEFSILCSYLENIIPHFATNLLFLDASTLKEEVQSAYDKSFVLLGYDMKAMLNK